MTELKVISTAEVGKHRNKENSVWMIIHNNVYNVTSFLGEHPGGEDTLLEVAGKEATQDFEDVGHSDDARELMKKYLIGTLPPEERNTPDSKTREVPCEDVTGPDKFVEFTACSNYKTSSASRSRCSLCSQASCPHLPRSTEKTWRTYDGSPSSRSLDPVKSEYKAPTTPRTEGRVNAIFVPKERPRRRPCEPRKTAEPPPRSNLKWAVIALAGAVVLGFVLKKYLSK